ncbi:LAME_0H19262g1_1 [Lachancea meyersii CBS 8951]|uniref:LAME_0H19262g1_1 n=1 Tax=Lachancea meyersii CBS 8951 TaxID=1266667 RepID=A0A1G4KJ06_9SACH|nr:LAME_0H19262g1_1 [Lachancea meyersii CBS 8951]
MDPELQIKALVDTLAPRTAHQYKLYHTKYLQWCRDNRLVRSPVADHPYKDVIVTATLVHWFILSKFVCAKDSQLTVSVLRKMISAFKFLHRVCKAYEPEYPYDLDYEYLEGVARLHVSACAEKSPISPLDIVSSNMWSPHGKRFSEKYFKGGIEKLRFLADFHIQQYWHLNFADRSRLTLGDLLAPQESQILLVDRVSEDSPSTIQRLALLRQNTPWKCPLTTLAAYFFLRFYGVSKYYRGDGFPDLLESDNWRFLPIIRGKFIDKYPREETMANYYADVFRTCHLSYKRREYFYNKTADNCQYPRVRRSEFEDLQDLGNGKQNTFFPENIGIDFLRHMNGVPVYEPAGPVDDHSISAIPQSLLVQVFPEVESYKRAAGKLSDDSKRFLKVLELLRDCLVAALPLINHFYPEHDLLRDSVFQSTEFQSFCRQKIEELRAKDELQQYEPESFDLNNTVQASNPVEIQTIASKPSAELTQQEAESESLHTFLRDQTFRMVQYQTATNFHLLLQSLSRVFEKLETKKSTREYILYQLGSLEQSLQERITQSSPDDVKQEADSSADTLAPSKPPDASQQPALYDSDAEDDEDYKEDGFEGDPNNDDGNTNLQSELQTLVSQVMDVKFKDAIEKQTYEIESRVQQLVAAQVKEEVRKQLAHLMNRDSPSLTPQPTATTILAPKRARDDEEEQLEQSREAQFALSSSLDSIEDVVLEWFTPNPEMGNECVHTMNRKFGKTWRTASTETSDLYRQRKLIVEFYICLVNQRKMDRYKAVAVCENLRGSETLEAFGNKLRQWKKLHNNNFDGLG